MSEAKMISVRGAREHNLKSVDVDIPRGKLVVVTGLSGSGKSTLAIDTIYAEGQRRYVESLSVYARQFLNVMEKPDVDQITGLSPAIAIEQKTTSRNPRSTVGTVTEIYDYLRLLFARAGTPHSPATGLPIQAQQVSDMVDRILAYPPGSRVILLAPVVRDRKGEYKRELLEFRKRGFQRVRIDGEIYDLDDVPELQKTFRHNIELVVDRIVTRDGIDQRLADSLRTALDQADGIALATVETEGGDASSITFSEKFACPVSGFMIPEIEPRLFSFNAPFGACTKCDGLGREVFFDLNRIIPDTTRYLRIDAIDPWKKTSSFYFEQTITSLSRHYGFNPDRQWRHLPEDIRELILYGSKDEEIQFEYSEGKRTYTVRRRYEGVIPNMERRYRETDSQYVRDQLERYQSSRDCSACGGFRLRPEALAVKIGKKHIGEVTQLTVSGALEWSRDAKNHLSAQNRIIAAPIFKEIRERLGFLNNVGLEYVTLSRNSGTLSGGESQRIRLASQIGSGLTGVLYVLDEPSIGLHQRDNKRLLATLKNLRDQGNTVIVVEHDEEAMREADHLLDIGPGAGIHGGEIVAQGRPAEVEINPKSITGQYLSGRRQIDYSPERRAGYGRAIRVIGATSNNLKSVTVDFPLGKFICVTGVSGSGKSTLTFGTLYHHAAAFFSGYRIAPDNCEMVEGLGSLAKVIDIDQRPIGRTPRSNPATYTDAFLPIRNWFTELPESRARGYKPGRFSFNVKGGRCEACRGDGVIKIAMHFLPDIYVTCESCRGARYNRETLEVKYRNQSIADILNMTVEEAEAFFAAVPAIHEKLKSLCEVGLGYIKLGQPATTLSGGEAQRVKLAKELSRRTQGGTLYILDEPTTGLHFEDIKRLLKVLHRLVTLGNTVVVVEHNLDVIKTADWIIDMGPEGGDSGGRVIAEGTPEDVADNPRSHTGQFLAKMLKPALVAAE
ncbi:MAG: excinuclease ABC subunit UvrA [Rhodobacteraceae bacterium]|nr:excinuclease ABC subunit UvrA [Paracoccaceae bacterium]